MNDDGKQDSHAVDEVVLSLRRPGAQGKRPLVQRTDVPALFRLAFYGAGIRLLPEQRWDDLRRAIPQKRGRSMRRRVEAGLRAYFGEEKAKAEIEAISAEYRSAFSRRLMLTACEANPNWSPTLDLEGGHRLQQALDKGRGVILWCDSFMSQSLIGKRMLHESGYRAEQVSLSDHGLSKSRFGQRSINSIQQRQELRHAGRLEFERGQEPAVTRRIQKILRSGGLVTITNNTATASKVAELPFGAAGRLVVATGPIRIAQSCQAALLPYAVIEEEPFRRYRGTIGDDLLGIGDPGDDGTKDLKRPVLAYREWIAALASCYPAQWMRWEGVAWQGEIEV